MAALQARRQFERTEARAHEAAHRHPGRCEHAPHQAVTSFAHPDAIPAVGPLAALRIEHFEACRPVFERDPAAQAAYLLGRELADDPHGVIARLLKARVRETIGHIARVGEYEQAAGVEVEPTDRKPAADVEA